MDIRFKTSRYHSIPIKIIIKPYTLVPVKF